MSVPSTVFPTSASRRGVLMVVSGPSGSGKTTLCRRLCEENEAVFSISCTTRAPRDYEVDGRDYFFLTEKDFEDRIQRGEFFEYARVHNHLYGTLKSAVGEQLHKGIDVLLDIDVQGAAQVRACDDELIHRCHSDIFILPPSLEELDRRLTGRGSESAERHALRMKNAAEEMEQWRLYQRTLISGTHEEDYAQFRAVLISERLRVNQYHV